MKELKADQEYFNKLANACVSIMESVKEDIDCLLDSEEDMFKRYMSFMRLNNLTTFMPITNDWSTRFMAMGKDLNHEIFHTKEFKKCSWDDVLLSKNPFFINDQEDMYSSEVSEKIQKKVAQLMKDLLE